MRIPRVPPCLQSTVLAIGSLPQIEIPDGRIQNVLVADQIAKLFQLHPCFAPRAYIDFRVEITSARTARIEIGDCDALGESDGHSWFAGLGEAPHPALDAIAGVVNPYARCHPVDDSSERFAWDIVIDRASAPQPVPQELKLAKISRGAAFQFEQRRTLRG